MHSNSDYDTEPVTRRKVIPSRDSPREAEVKELHIANYNRSYRASSMSLDDMHVSILSRSSQSGSEHHTIEESELYDQCNGSSRIESEDERCSIVFRQTNEEKMLCSKDNKGMILLITLCGFFTRFYLQHQLMSSEDFIQGVPVRVIVTTRFVFVYHQKTV